MRTRRLVVALGLAASMLGGSASAQAEPVPEGADAPLAPSSASDGTEAAPLPGGASATNPLPDPPPASPPAQAAEDEGGGVRVSARAGRGFTVEAGDAFAFNARARLQLRDTIVARDATTTGPEPSNEIHIRTVRLWLTGHVVSPKIGYGVQLAFGSNDFEAGSASPIFDAFVDFTHLRDFNVRVGQFFVPFDRARTIREFALQTVDRTAVVQELTLDRDVGIAVGSQDLGGLGGRLAYTVGLFGGEGRNRFGAQRMGFLYSARFSVRPFGAFDEDVEGDLERRPEPRLMLGVAAAYDQNGSRTRGTTGATYVLGANDYTWLAADTVFKWRGLSLMGEVVMRYATRDQRTGDVGGTLVTEHTRRGVGYLVQAGYLVHPRVEIWARWDELRTPWVTDPALVTQVAQTGRAIAGGVNYYLNGHAFKLQADAVHQFGGSFDSGRTFVRLQLDASF